MKTAAIVKCSRCGVMGPEGGSSNETEDMCRVAGWKLGDSILYRLSDLNTRRHVGAVCPECLKHPTSDNVH